MGLQYRTQNTGYNSLLEKMSLTKITDINYGKNRFKITEEKIETKYEKILDPESADNKLKDLGFEYDNKEDYGGGFIYTLKGEIVASYDPHNMNIAVYQKLEDTLPKPEVKMPEVKPNNVVDTNTGHGTVKESGKGRYIGGNKEHEVECPKCKTINKIKGNGMHTECSKCHKDLWAPGYSHESKVIEDVGFSYQQNAAGGGDQIISQGISDQTVADNIAQKSGGRREIDKDDPNKFMVVKASEKKTNENMHPYDVIDELEALGVYAGSNSFDSREESKMINYVRKAESKGLKAYTESDSGSDMYGIFLTKKALSPDVAQKLELELFDVDTFLSESTISEKPYQSPFQEEGRWSDNLSEDCVIKPGETYRFVDGQEITIDRIEGRTIYVTTADGREESMQYEEIDQLLHNGELTKISESEEKYWMELSPEEKEKYNKARIQGLSHPDSINKAKEKNKEEVDERKVDVVKHSAEGKEYWTVNVNGKDAVKFDEEAKAKEYAKKLEQKESVNEFIKKSGGEYEVVSHKGKNLGKYKTEAEAKKRLGQVEYFKTHEAVDLAEKSILVKTLLEKEKISEKQKKFIIENMNIKLEDWQRDVVERIVVEKYSSLIIKGKTHEKVNRKTN